MVRLTWTSLCKHVKKPKDFLDKLRVHVKGGVGGQGIPKYGGVGGQGGDVFVVGSNSTSLMALKSQNDSLRFKGGPGGHSQRRALLGAPGSDCLINAPIGVVIMTDNQVQLGEINSPDDKVLVARGGAGGGPSNNFQAQQGQGHSIKLDLKLIADIGLVGFPNAGKSTFLKAISRATPKIAAYPFTTLKPQLGIMGYPDKRQISVADLPGLIEGAHINVGMGHNFLKHVERTKLLLFIVDLVGFRLGPNYPRRTAAETVLLLNKELELYKPELTQKPAVLALNKMDLPEAPELAEIARRQIESGQEFAESLDPALRPETLVKFDEIFTISARDRTNTEELKLRMRVLLDAHADKDNAAFLEEQHAQSRDTVQRQLSEHHRGGMA